MSFLLLTFVILRCLYSICTWSFGMVNVEMPKDSTPKEALVAIQERRQSEKRNNEAPKSNTPPRHSARLSSGYSSSSPGQSKKKSSPAPKPKKKRPNKALIDSDSDEETKVEEMNALETDVAEEHPNYMHRVVSTSDCNNRPAIGKVGGYVPEKNAYEITFTYSDDKEPKEHVDYCNRNWVEENLVDSETAAAWAEAVQKALSPITSPKEKESTVPNMGKRSRVSTSLYKPDDNTPLAKRRGKKKKIGE